jgi:hypothetical protein
VAKYRARRMNKKNDNRDRRVDRGLRKMRAKAARKLAPSVHWF